MAGAALTDGGPIGRLLIVDVSVPSNPVEVGFVDLPISLAADVFVSGDLAFVAAWDQGVRIVDISNPAAPVEVGSIDGISLATSPPRVFVSSGLAFFAAGKSGLLIIKPDLATQASDSR